MSNKNIVIVGGGLAGLMATIKAAEAGVHVDLISLVPVKRSHSVCAQGGINGAVDTKGEGDSPAIHFDDTVYGGDFLANQKPVKDMCDAAPSIRHMMDRMGVMFNRTPEGLLDFPSFRRNTTPPYSLCRSNDRSTINVRIRRTSSSSRSQRTRDKI